MKTIQFFLAALMLAAVGCGGSSLAAPDRALPRPDAPILSGQVHVSVTWGDPPLADARIEVVGADGVKSTGLSDDDGFYRVAAVPGSVTVTASKPGFETKKSLFTLTADTVLNFSLSAE